MKKNKKMHTFRLDDELLQDAKKYLNAKSFTEAIEIALKRIVSGEKHIEFLSKHEGRGKFKDFLYE